MSTVRTLLAVQCDFRGVEQFGIAGMGLVLGLFYKGPRSFFLVFVLLASVSLSRVSSLCLLFLCVEGFEE